LKTEASLEDWLDDLNTQLECEMATVMLQIPGDDHLEIVAHRGFIVAPELHLPIGHGVAGEVFETRTPEIVQDVKVDPRFVSEGHGIDSLLCYPIYNEQRGVVGVVNLSNPVNVDQFQEKHFRRLESFLENRPIDRDRYVQEEI